MSSSSQSFAQAAAKAPSSSSSSSDASKPASSGDDEEVESQRIVQHYKLMRSQISEMANKINELDQDRNEHQLVLRALEGLDPSRRCFRSIGGVLVERTIAEVRPAVEKNLKGIEEVISKLSTDLKEREQQADEFRAKYNIQMGDPDKASQSERSQATREGGAGVLA